MTEQEVECDARRLPGDWSEWEPKLRLNMCFLQVGRCLKQNYEGIPSTLATGDVFHLITGVKPKKFLGDLIQTPDNAAKSLADFLPSFVTATLTILRQMLNSGWMSLKANWTIV